MRPHESAARASRLPPVLGAALLTAAALIIATPTSSGAAMPPDSGGDGRAYPNQSCRELGYTNPTPYDLDNGGGYVEIFYSRSKDANCAQTVNTTGQRQMTSIHLSRHSSNGGDFAADLGWFISYAGAVVLTDAGGSCIDFKGYMQYKGGSEASRERVHCG